jgi:CRP/FNR family transcriptional regulator, cyclic AMP receptor protein
MSNRELVTGVPRENGLTYQARTIAEISKLVESTHWADNFTGKEVDMLARYLHVCAAEKDAVIVREAGREAYLCLLIEGQVRIVKRAGESEKEIGSAGVGKIVGEMSLIDGEPRSASVIADEPSLVVILTGEGFNRLCNEAPRLGVKVLMKISKLISQRLRQTSGTLLEYLGEGA